ncbi:MAG: hypothetical protein LBI45_04765 [Bacteroidales bacterium]|jgi:hypothetical protein|nr:hypothetical protein [Bacteroidales bacterium]
MENYSNQISYENPMEENKRPAFLTFLCVLTFIGSGAALLSNLATPMFLPSFIEIMRDNTMFANIIEIYEKMLEIPVWQYYFLAIFCATAIVGAIYMLKMKKIGFHIYAISQIAQMAIGHFLMGGSFKINYFSGFVTLLFIGLYATCYKKFTNLEENNEQINNNY